MLPSFYLWAAGVCLFCVLPQLTVSHPVAAENNVGEKRDDQLTAGVGKYNTGPLVLQLLDDDDKDWKEQVTSNMAPKKGHKDPRPDPPKTPFKSTKRFLKYVNHTLTIASSEFSEAQWRYETNITEHNSDAANEAEVTFNKILTTLIHTSDFYSRHPDNTAIQRRLLSLLQLSGGNVPKSAKDQKALARVISEMTRIFATATYMGAPLDPDLTDTLATSRDEKVLRDAFIGWRNVTGPSILPVFTEDVRLSNTGAKDNDYDSTAAFWLSQYDMKPSEFEEMIDGVWEEVLPLYEQLHCYVRGKLSEVYGKDKVQPNGKGDEGLMFGHLLGNMWAQDWANIYDLVVPFPDQTPIDITPSLQKQGYDAWSMHQLSESFYVSLGYDALPDSFWSKSMLVRPNDRDVVCHASAWDFSNDDLRIKMCTTVTGEDLYTIHHEQGHLYYDHYYKNQPALFRDAAADFFHEAIGDTVLLSVLVPSHLKKIGLIVGDVDDSYEQTVNAQMKMALSKVAILGWSLLVDKWRWRVFDGKIKPEEYQSTWEEMVEKYQGLKRPVPASEGDFDPGAKFHVAANVPYLRYFGAAVLQFQLHAALCDAATDPSDSPASDKVPLHSCSIYQNERAGALFKRLLTKGKSIEWRGVLGSVVDHGRGREEDGSGKGTKKVGLEGGSLTRYFKVLDEWLRKENKERGWVCGWGDRRGK
ncbi:hypothetical protein HDV00_006039, partial [Rhizophlyctis rosea]